MYDFYTSKYSRDPVSTDSVSAAAAWKKNWQLKEIKGS
jgi:hypothetical protein